MAAAALAAAGTLAGCKAKDAAADGKAPKDEKTAESQTVFAVTTIEATRGELQDYLEFGGDVTAKTSVDAMPDAAGSYNFVYCMLYEVITTCSPS